MLPLEDSEEQFIGLIRAKSKIEPQLITEDLAIQEKIIRHPAILWAASKNRLHQH